jgi:serine/threonine protein kinase/Tol biopolymer transport system component
MPIGPGARFGPYAVDSLLGTGGMGEVYLATDTRLHRTVAIKVLPQPLADNATRRERFTREARAAAGLSHPHICALYDVGEEDGRPFLVMEHLDGETLADRLRRGPLPLAEAVRCGIQIADALEHAHRQGVVHRDVKPSNVMLTRTGAKLLDFGLARLHEPDQIFTGSLAAVSSAQTESLTDEGTIVGTVQYMAPEQIEAGPVDDRTDLFALGVVLFEMATGKPAFEGTSAASLIAAVLERTPPAVSATRASVGAEATPPLLDQIVARCLAKNPDERWQTASDLRQALTWVAESSSPGALGAPVRQSRSRLAWIAGSVLLGGGLAAAALMLNADRASEARPWRYVVPAPENTTFNPAGSFQALSPDGSQLAFIAAAPQGGTALWILRSADSVAPKQIAGTAGAYHPFWSPDGRYVAFGAAGKLKRLEIATGLTETVADGWFTAASWGAAGVILQAVNRPGEAGPRMLHRVPATGGESLPATTLDSARSETAHAAPHFLPDGRHFLFLARSTNPQFDGTLYVGSLDSSDRVLLGHKRSAAIYASGFLLFMRDQTLLAQRFDTGTLTLTGEPSVVAENVDKPAAQLRGSISASQTGILAYRPATLTELVWFDRNGRRIESVGDPGHYADPSLSPDGQRIAVARKDPANGHLDVWVIDVKRRAPSPFTLAETPERRPLWSTDGSRLAYLSSARIVWKPLDGTGKEEELIGALTSFDAPDSWSPDGALVYEAFDGVTTRLWMAPAGDRKAVALSAAGRTELQGQVSPDGQWLAYVANEAGRYDVYVRRFPTGEGKTVVSPAGGIEPAWRRDGKELFFLAADRFLMSVSVKSGPSLDVSSPAPLFETKMSTVVNNTMVRNQYAVFQDGQRFLINQPTGSAPSIVVVVNWPGTLKASQ